jgi:hypothetical protein
MKKPSNKYIWKVDYTLCNLLIHDTQVDQTDELGQAAKEPGRPQLFLSVDPFTRLIMPFKLSYEEEETKSEH